MLFKDKVWLLFLYSSSTVEIPLDIDWPMPHTQVDEPALREGLPLKQERWQSYLDWAVKSFRLATAVAKAPTQVVTHLCYSEFADILEVCLLVVSHLNPRRCVGEPYCDWMLQHNYACAWTNWCSGYRWTRSWCSHNWELQIRQWNDQCLGQVWVQPRYWTRCLWCPQPSRAQVATSTLLHIPSWFGK